MQNEQSKQFHMSNLLSKVEIAVERQQNCHSGGVKLARTNSSMVCSSDNGSEESERSRSNAKDSFCYNSAPMNLDTGSGQCPEPINSAIL